MIKYRREAIESALRVLDNLEVKGIENCKRVVMLSQIIDNPEAIEEDKKEQSDGNLHERSEE